MSMTTQTAVRTGGVPTRIQRDTITIVDEPDRWAVWLGRRASFYFDKGFFSVAYMDAYVAAMRAKHFRVEGWGEGHGRR